ncbi:morphogenesis protein [Aspergillus heterothallicus]
MSFFSRVFRGKDSNAAKKSSKSPVAASTGPAKPAWTDAWQRTEIAPEEVQQLLRACTQEFKARALQTPFMLLPFRPSSDTVTARTFIRNYFSQSLKRGSPFAGDELAQELRLTDPMVLCSVMKWCWSRLPGGVVTWEAYELFKVGEQDSQFARDAFSTFIPISVDSDARTKIIFDFFDLLTAIAAHGKSNGLGGRKLSRYAGWWAFEHTDTGNGFEAAYNNWASAADATSHLFFAYLRSLSPDTPRGLSGISTLPIALQTLVQATEYPPETPTLLQVSTTKVVMIVDTVSPTPFALLRRAKNFEYRDSDYHLQEFASYEEPLKALTDECLRVLKCISSTNQSSAVSEPSASNRDASWSRFEDLGFGGSLDATLEESSSISTSPPKDFGGSLRSVPHSGGGDLGRPTTPSWADFMSSGFSGDDSSSFKAPAAPLLLPPDKVLPPIAAVRGQSSQSHKRGLNGLNNESSMDPGELASITTLELDDSFWWVWISSLAGEEPATRKAVFGRCALLETIIRNAKWLVLEEQVKGAAPEPEPGAYIVEKKRFFGFSTRRNKLGRSKSSAKKISSVEDSYKRPNNQAPHSKASIAPDQHARIQAAAAALQKKHREEQEIANGAKSPSAQDASYSTKTNSIMTLQPSILNEASQAMKWASNYDKHAVRAAYLNDTRAGTGAVTDEQKDQPTPSITASSKQPPAAPPKDVAPAEPSTATNSTRKPTEEAKVSNKAAATLTVEPPPKDSVDADVPHKLKKKPANTGFKNMFGTSKKKEPETKLPAKPTPAEGSAVAAARAALEGKAKASQANGPATLRKKPAPVAAPVKPTKADTRVAPEPPAVVAPQSQPSEPEAPAPAPEVMTDHPKIRREAEYDALSRVDTNEQVAADQEFSRFDQGPLLDQPAFAPEDSPTQETSPKHAVPEPVSPPSSPPRADNNASHDRWAQIRKNAAERVAQAEVRTSIADDDSGNTSEEESFETRAARIKARVAELTGNMQAANRP